MAASEPPVGTSSDNGEPPAVDAVEPMGGRAEGDEGSAVGGEPRVRSDVVRNRKRLLDAAAEVFAEHGPQGGVVDVARIAGVGVGTLYRHFPTKDDLVNALVEEILAEMVVEAREALREPDGGGLRRFLDALGRQQSSRFGSISRLWNTPQHLSVIDDLQQAIDALLADAQLHGQVRAELVPSDLVAVVWSIRGVIEMTRDLAPDGWRRYLEVVFGGLSPSVTPLTETPLPMDVVGEAMARGHGSHGGPGGGAE